MKEIRGIFHHIYAKRVSKKRRNNETTGDQVITETEYDLGNRVILTRDALGRETRYEHDKLGRQTAVISEAVWDPATEQMVHIRTETVYDDLGRRVKVRENLKQTSPLDKLTIDSSDMRETDYEYDSAGRLTAVILPAVADPENDNELTRPRYEYGYDERGNQTSILDPKGRETRFTYDQQGRQLTRTLPLGVETTEIDDDFTEQFAYYPDGRLWVTWTSRVA